MTKRLHTHEERFDARVIRGSDPDDCWGWSGSVLPGSGYAQFWPYGRAGGKVYAHIYAYERWVGSVPAGNELDHTCHTRDADCLGGPTCPHRRCSNPTHLRAVTPAANKRLALGWTEDDDGQWRCGRGHPINEAEFAKRHVCVGCFNIKRLNRPPQRRTAEQKARRRRNAPKELAAVAAQRRRILLLEHPALEQELDAIGLLSVRRRLLTGWTYDETGWTSPRLGWVPFGG